MCGCKERRAAIGAGARALVRGDRAEVLRQVSFVGRSSAQDMRALASKATSAAAHRLSTLRRR